MSYFKIRSYAKINLALNIVGKKGSLHKIESIVSFLNLHDEILIKIIKSKNHKIKFIGKFANKIKSNNTIFMNAASILKFLIKKKFIKVSKREVNIITDLIGSDVILGMYSNNLILKSNKTLKNFNFKTNIHALVVKPNFGCSTKKIYSEVKHFKKARFNKPMI